MSTEPLYRALHDIKLNTVRKAISSACYTKSWFKTWGSFAFDIALYAGFMVGVFVAESAWARLGFGVAAGCAVAFMFVWAHDAAHGALFTNDSVAEVFGTLTMLPSLNMYRLWCHGHNRVHHGFTSYSPVDWIWRPLSPAEYAAKSRWGRFLYRLERSPFTCAVHYLTKVWWPGMVMYDPSERPRERVGFILHKVITLSFAALLSIAAWYWAGGVVGVLAAVVLPFIVFNYFIALFVYLHHTHPDVPFFDDRHEWSNTIGQVYCAITWRCSRLSEFLIHNIMIHVPHHVDQTIPFYRLKTAYRDLQREYGKYIHEYPFRWGTVFMIFRRCKLYDFEAKRWYSFREAAELMPGTPQGAL